MLSISVDILLGWLVLAGFTGLWATQYWRGNSGILGKLLAFKNLALALLFLQMSLEPFVPFWAAGTYRRMSLGLVILSYALLQIEVYRQQHENSSANND